MGFPGGSMVKNTAANAGDMGLNPGLGRRTFWRRKWQPTPEPLPGKPHGRRSLVGYSLWGHRAGHDWLHFRFHFHIELMGTGDMGSILGQEDPLEEGIATHSSILAWRIPWTEKPGRLQFTGSKRVEHDQSNLAPMTSWPKVEG